MPHKEVVLSKKNWLGAGLHHQILLLICAMRCLAANRLRVRHLHNVVRLQHLIKDTLLAVWVRAKQFVVLHFMEHRLVVEVWFELAGHVMQRGHRVTVHEACRDMHLSSFAFGVGLD